MNLTKILLISLTLATASFSAAPSRTAVDGGYDWGWDEDNSPSTVAASDTVVSTAICTLMTDFNPERGYEYIIVRDAITGTGADSVDLTVNIACKDGAGGNLLYTVLLDTMAASAGEAVNLEIGSAALGLRYDVTVTGGGDNGAEVILNRVYLFKRRAVSTTKEWR